MYAAYGKMKKYFGLRWIIHLYSLKKQKKIIK